MSWIQSRNFLTKPERFDNGANGGLTLKLIRSKYPLYKYVFAIMDWGTMVAAFFLTAELFSKWNVVFSFSGIHILSALVWSALAGVVTMSVFHYFNLYKLNVIVTVANQTLRLLIAAILTVIIGALVGIFTGFSVVHERLFILGFGGFAFFVALIVRVGLLRNVYMLLARYKILRRNALIVGAGETAKKLAVTLFLNKHIGIDVSGFVDDDLEVGTPVFRGSKVLGRISEIEQAAEKANAREVVICIDNMDHPRFVELVDACAHTNLMVKICSPLYEVIPSRMFIEHYGDMPVVSVSQRAPSLINETYKRVFDVVLATIATAFLLPAFVIIALLIKLGSPGPVLYRQIRIGRNGRPFTFYKFRSMSMGSDTDENRKRLIAEMIRSGSAVELAEKGTTKIVNKANVTSVGRWLRRTSLDELPQFFNVLKGDMSLVGPRPCLPYEWENYEEWHKKRLSVAPGCTGVWQVSGRSEVGFRDMVILDLYYIQNASLHMDLKLILKTIPVMMFGKGGG